eukprot:1184051-Prorocentrum_minimum.AAC.3
MAKLQLRLRFRIKLQIRRIRPMGSLRSFSNRAAKCKSKPHMVYGQGEVAEAKGVPAKNDRDIKKGGKMGKQQDCRPAACPGSAWTL